MQKEYGRKVKPSSCSQRCILVLRSRRYPRPRSLFQPTKVGPGLNGDREKREAISSFCIKARDRSGLLVFIRRSWEPIHSSWFLPHCLIGTNTRFTSEPPFWNGSHFKRVATLLLDCVT